MIDCHSDNSKESVTINFGELLVFFSTSIILVIAMINSQDHE